jgi:hypothetical protein
MYPEVSQHLRSIKLIDWASCQRGIKEGYTDNPIEVTE